MERIVIFDFYRTIYNPDSSSLVQGANEILEELKSRGYRLFLLSYGEWGRQSLIEDLGIADRFEKILVTTQKTEQEFQELLRGVPGSKEVFVVGDRIRGEIKIGRKLGFTTIWVRLEDELLGEEPEPDFAVRNLAEILKILP